VQLRQLLRVAVLILFLCLGLTLPTGAASKSSDVTLTIPDTTISLQGFAAPNAIVVFIENGSVVGTATADATGFYNKVLSAQATGLRTVGQYFTDKEGVRSEITTKTVSVTSQQNTLLEVFIPPTITRRSNATLQPGSVVQLSGYTISNGLVTLKLPFGGSQKVTANKDGFYEFLYDSSPLGEGGYTVSVSGSKSGIAQKSEQSIDVQFSIVDESGPARPDFVVSPNQLPPPVPQSPDDGSVIEGNSTQISGESVPGAQINIYENGILYGSIFADDSGRWSFEYIARFSPVTFSFEACINGQCSVLSKTIILYFNDIVQACSAVFELANYRFWSLQTEEALSLDVFLSSGDGILYVDWGDSTLKERFDHDADRPQSYRKSYEKAGDYNGTARFVQGDCEVVRYFSVQVSDPLNANFVWSFWLFLATVVLYSANRYYRLRQENDTIELKYK